MEGATWLQCWGRGREAGGGDSEQRPGGGSDLVSQPHPLRQSCCGGWGRRGEIGGFDLPRWARKNAGSGSGVPRMPI